MMTSELRYVLKSNSDYEGCSDQESLREILVDLRDVAGELDLDFAEALVRSEPPESEGALDPCI